MKEDKQHSSGSNQVLILIKEGFKEGDTLDLSLDNTEYAWNPEAQLLTVNATENMNISTVIENISLKGDGLQERMLNVKFASQGGFIVELQNFGLTPEVAFTAEETNGFLNAENSIEESYAIEYSPDTEWDSGFMMYQESSVGANFLDSAEEELLPFYLSQDTNGDIYTILKNSFKQQDELEIWGYDIAKDKVNLEEFFNEFGDALEFSISKEDNDLQLHLSSTDNDFNIVFKEASTSLSEESNLDDLLQSLVLDPFNTNK